MSEKERRQNPVDRCPDKFKEIIAHQSVKLLLNRIVVAKELSQQKEA